LRVLPFTPVALRFAMSDPGIQRGAALGLTLSQLNPAQIGVYILASPNTEPTIARTSVLIMNTPACGCPALATRSVALLAA
jgi:hypothetical protein